MPFSGGFAPSPERSGGGEGSSAAPHLQRVFESLAAARGPLYDQTTGSAVGAENMAYARAITFDLYGANRRFANEMNPQYATVAGNLTRWETILAQPPLPGDTETTRQKRVAAALQRIGQPNNYANVIATLQGILGGLYVGLTLFGPSTALSWWPGLNGSAAFVSAASGNQATIAGLSGIPTAAPGTLLTLSNASTASNNGTFPVQSRVSASSVVAINNGGITAPDYGVGGTVGSPKISWSLVNPNSPWMSTISHVLVQVNPAAVAGFTNSNGTPNGKFFAAVNQINPVLDLMLPADVTFDFYILSSHGVLEFRLDEHNLDLLAIGT